MKRGRQGVVPSLHIPQSEAHTGCSSNPTATKPPFSESRYADSRAFARQEFVALTSARQNTPLCCAGVLTFAREKTL
eukprot:1035837-Rhodomonas_salina.1